MLNKRQEKKRHTQAVRFTNYVMWMMDLRGYLLEADHENIDMRIILRQFKRRIKREPTFAVVTNMTRYCRTAIDRI